MGKFFSYDSPLIQGINKIVDSIVLSLLWIVFSLPIITFGASTTALYYTVNKVLRHERSHLFREFWSSFKSNFKQSTIVWFVLALFYYLLITNCFIMYQSGNMVLLVLYIIFLALLIMWTSHLFPHIARFENKTSIILKNCFFLMIRHCIKTFSVLILFVMTLVVALIWWPAIFILPVGLSYAVSLLYEPIFRKYMSEEDAAAEDERNMVYRN
jgi:uncharacterized membrane protein YesL